MGGISRRDVLKASVLPVVATAGLPLLAGCEPVEHPQAKATLIALLRKNQALEWKHGFATRANHAGMGLVALYRLGASPKRLERYFASVPRPRASIAGKQRAVKLTPETWTTHLGDGRTLHAYGAYFRERVKADGLERTLRAHAGTLARGSSAAAFHGLIKLGTALDVGDTEEIILALAWWASAHHPAPKPAHDRKPVSVGALIEKLAAEKALTALKGSGGIVNRMNLVYRHPRFRELLAPIEVEAERPLHDIASAVRQAFADKHHFTLLHGLTSTHAMRLVVPYLDEPAPALSSFGHALGAAYLTAVHMSRHDLGTPVPEKRPGLAALRVGARRSDDVHVIKVVYACLSEAQAYGEEPYLRLAARDLETPARFT